MRQIHTDLKTYDYTEVQELTNAIFEAMGCTAEDARQITSVLLRADLRGIKTHGLVRLKEYYRLYEMGKIQPRARIRLLHETPSTGLLDAGKGFGMIAGKQAMKMAIEKAKVAGTGWVSVRNSNHFGIAGAYSFMAVEEDMIGIAMTNANPLVAPTYSKKPMLGTNPLAVGVPAKQYPPFMADFATAPVARGKLDMWQLTKTPAPEGLLQDAEGLETDNPGILSLNGSIKTLGGKRDSGGHKGFCLSAIVDIFSAVLPGANFGPTVIPTLQYLTEANASGKDQGIGHFFGAIRVDAFQTKDAFLEQMDHWIETFRNGEPIDGKERIIIPGDPEREQEEYYLNENRIPLMEEVTEEVDRIRKALGVTAKVIPAGNSFR